ncbi:uncharacterized protein TNCV_915571 [Trichonephila clavipes]|nr:uncharacterized protein TNCV_915571 [Trichonephila clavipes]
MTAYYPVFDDEIEQGPPGMPGIGFKLTNDGNYDMEGKVLRNVLDPEELTDSCDKIDESPLIRLDKGKRAPS